MNEGFFSASTLSMEHEEVEGVIEPFLVPFQFGSVLSTLIVFVHLIWCLKNQGSRPLQELNNSLVFLCCRWVVQASSQWLCTSRVQCVVCPPLS